MVQIVMTIPKQAKEKKNVVLFAKALESVMQRRVKLIGDKDTLYTGYPAQMIREVVRRYWELKDGKRRAYKRDWIRAKRKR